MDNKDINHGNVKESPLLNIPLKEARDHLEPLSPEKRLKWGLEQFDSGLALTTSFGIQSSVLLHMLHKLDDEKKIKVFWVDTGYLPAETYKYADELTNQLDLNITVVQSNISPARMEALYGQLWKTNSVKDLEKYHQIRKVDPLEKALIGHKITCWASGVRKSQTDTRSEMTLLDPIRKRLSLRPILDWSNKDIFYYMKSNNLPQHPLFEKGYSTVGDWHSSAPESEDVFGRKTRFGGLKQECGLHLGSNDQGDSCSDQR